MRRCAIVYLNLCLVTNGTGSELLISNGATTVLIDGGDTWLSQVIE